MFYHYRSEGRAVRTPANLTHSDKVNASQNFQSHTCIESRFAYLWARLQIVASCATRKSRVRTLWARYVVLLMMSRYDIDTYIQIIAHCMLSGYKASVVRKVGT